jgi:hypothetical protein
VAKDKNNLKFQASCLAGILGHLILLYPQLVRSEHDAMISFGINAGIQSFGMANKWLENKSHRMKRSVRSKIISRPNLIEGMFLLAAYAYGIHNGLVRLAHSSGTVYENAATQIGLYLLFSIGAIIFAGSKPNSEEPGPAASSTPIKVPSRKSFEKIPVGPT